MKKKERLKILLVILIAVFMMFGAAALLLGSFRRSQQKYQEKKEALSALDQVPTVVPTEGVSVTPSPSPTPRPTATPTPIPVKVETFNPDDFWDYWYSTDGLVTVNVYDISQESISFSFYQTDRNQTDAVSADIKAKVAGNAANFSFTDSAGNYATGNLIFDSGEL